MRAYALEEREQNIRTLVGLQRHPRLRLLVTHQLSLPARHTASPAGECDHVTEFQSMGCGQKQYRSSWRFGHRPEHRPPWVSHTAGCGGDDGGVRSGTGNHTLRTAEPHCVEDGHL